MNALAARIDRPSNFQTRVSSTYLTRSTRSLIMMPCTSKNRESLSPLRARRYLLIHILHCGLLRMTCSQEYRVSQAFFLLMGGLHIYHESGRPIGPLSSNDAIDLIRRGRIYLPSARKIEALSTTLSIGKLFACSLLMLFVAKCVSRIPQRLTVAPLEAMALAHTFFAVVSFAPWWAKPMNVASPEHVPLEAFSEARRSSINTRRSQRVSQSRSVWDIIYAYILGGQDILYDMDRLAYVPTFWSGDPDSVFEEIDPDSPPPESTSAYFLADAAALFLAIPFGAIHFIAWDDQLPYHIEHILWRLGSIFVASAPAVILCTYILTIIPRHFENIKLMGLMLKCACVPCALLYMISRLILIAIVCSSTWRPAAGVYTQASFWKYVAIW